MNIGDEVSRGDLHTFVMEAQAVIGSMTQSNGSSTQIKSDSSCRILSFKRGIGARVLKVRPWWKWSCCRTRRTCAQGACSKAGRGREYSQSSYARKDQNHIHDRDTQTIDHDKFMGPEETSDEDEYGGYEPAPTDLIDGVQEQQNEIQPGGSPVEVADPVNVPAEASPAGDAPVTVPQDHDQGTEELAEATPDNDAASVVTEQIPDVITYEPELLVEGNIRVDASGVVDVSTEPSHLEDTLLPLIRSSQGRSSRSLFEAIVTKPDPEEEPMHMVVDQVEIPIVDIDLTHTEWTVNALDVEVIEIPSNQPNPDKPVVVEEPVVVPEQDGCNSPRRLTVSLLESCSKLSTTKSTWIPCSRKASTMTLSFRTDLCPLQRQKFREQQLMLNKQSKTKGFLY